MSGDEQKLQMKFPNQFICLWTLPCKLHLAYLHANNVFFIKQKDLRTSFARNSKNDNIKLSMAENMYGRYMPTWDRVTMIMNWLGMIWWYLHGNYMVSSMPITTMLSLVQEIGCANVAENSFALDTWTEEMCTWHVGKKF